jgi:hypothetical protein
MVLSFFLDFLPFLFSLNVLLRHFMGGLQLEHGIYLLHMFPQINDHFRKDFSPFETVLLFSFGGFSSHKVLECIRKLYRLDMQLIVLLENVLTLVLFMM